MPLTQQEYHDFMSAVHQIRDLYTTMETEVKKYSAESGESKQKQASIEVTLQRLEAEMNKPPAAATRTIDSNLDNDILETKSIHPEMIDKRMRRIMQKDHCKAFFKAMKHSTQAVPGEERKLLNMANSFDAPAINDQYMTPEQKAVFTTGLALSEDTQGGLFAPPEFVAEIIKNLVLFSPMRQFCKVRNTSNRSVQLPKRTSTLTTAQWVGERAVRTDVTGWNLGRIEIPTNEMYSLVLITEQDLEDSQFDLETELRTEISEQFGVAEGRALLSGDAQIQPQGILTHPLIPIKKSGVSSLPTADTLINMYYDLPSVYASRAQFYMARQTVGLIRQLKYPGGEQSYIWQPGAGPSGGGLDTPPNTILGSPYYEVPDMPLAGVSSNSILYGDLSRAYLVVQRLGMTFKRLAERWVENSQIGIYARARIGGQVVLPEALRIYQLGT